MKEQKIRILLVEDEEKILQVLEAYLNKEGYEVLKATDGLKALEIFKTEEIHLLILDLMLPKLSGEEVCRQIREFSVVPIIMVTAKTEEDDTLEGLAIGADDYVTKPFSPREVVGRVKALLRRSYRDHQPVAQLLQFNNGELEIDADRVEVKVRGESVNLTPNEFKLLMVLLSHPGQVFSREQLVESAFGFDYDGFDRTIDTHIKNIRQKIERDPKSPVYIQTVYGMGYKFGGIR